MKNNFTMPIITNKGQQLLLPFTSIEEEYNRLGFIPADKIVWAQPLTTDTLIPWEYKYVYQNVDDDPCLGCYNHPKNGGSGFCNCTIPFMNNIPY